MTPVPYRAVTSALKDKRRTMILDTALQLFEKDDYPNVSINNICKKAGIAKGTLFLYFKTKEELFLSLAGREISAWIDEFDAELTDHIASGAALSISSFIPVVERCIRKSTTVLRFFAILDATLETNISYESARSFKFMLGARIVRSGALIEKCLPGLAPGSGADIFLSAYILMIGLFPVAYPAPVVEKVLTREPELSMMKIDFHERFILLLEVLLIGFSHKKG